MRRAALALICFLIAGGRTCPAEAGQQTQLFSRDNLVAWCIVPYDAKQRSPEERAQMLERLGLRHFAYDWRAKHLPSFELEIEAIQKHHIELTAVWFPDSLNPDARFILDALKRHVLKPDLWVAAQIQPHGDKEKTVAAGADVIRPIAREAGKIGCRVGLYNHGGWFGEPDNQLAIVEKLKAEGIENLGIVYNLHHGHAQTDRFPSILQKTKPYLLCITLNGMARDGDKNGREILPIGKGELDSRLLQEISESGYRGRIAVLNHTDEDAETRLRENLDGLERLVGKRDVKSDAPQPFGPTPSVRQLSWHEMEFYGFLHFTVNTFTDKEWGNGDEDEKVFNPTDFDADQIVRTAKDAGMKGLVLTCKHHDGFCLWPSKYTEHSVKNSRWKDGKGDLVREISLACHRHGLKFGVYLSPWDRNSKVYGTPEYVIYYRNQLGELLTNYGEVFVVWFDGANGGDGYYGGARETRHIDNRTYYEWPNTWKIVRGLMPGAVMFSDAGPDIRWVGNENGIAGDPCWATLDLTRPGRYPGGSSSGLNSGERPGTAWLPAECDVSIRPGWFYHAGEDAKVKTPQKLLEIYYKSVGRGACLNLNIPPDRRGRIHDDDVKALREFRRILDATFATNLAAGAMLTASDVRRNESKYGPQNLLDGNRTTYWSTDDDVKTPELLIELDTPKTFNVVSLREFLPLGQRIEAFAIDVRKDGNWQEFATGTSIGNHRLIRAAPVTSDKVRLRITQSAGCPALCEFGLFVEPKE